MAARLGGRCTLLLLLAIAAASPVQAALSQRTIDVLHYAAAIQPDIAAKTIQGHVVLDFAATSSSLQSIAFDNDGLTVDAVREAGAALAFTQHEKRLLITLKRPAEQAGQRQIEIDYHGAPRFGLQIHPDRSQAYTIFATSQWLIGIDAPDERATLDLTVTLPAGFKAVGNGWQIGHRTLANGLEMYRWRQEMPAPAYTYGFAAGKFNEVIASAGEVQLRFLSDALNQGELRKVFADTADMLRYFEQRAGVPYPGKRYTQALVADTIGQELAGFSLMSESYGREVLADPRNESLIAHEAAHQWWGNMVTCARWNEFWLNEAFANFLAATYMEHRFGKAEYEKSVSRWRVRHQKLKAEGKDKPLLFPDWNKPTSDDRAVVYQKGAYVLHLLRMQLGEDVFWRGIRDYTRKHFGTSVTTRDFQAAMEKSAGKPLDKFFDAWVYSSDPR
ncbi:MAG: M1 family metallopeptidase [Luteimonas sp.]